MLRYKNNNSFCDLFFVVLVNAIVFWTRENDNLLSLIMIKDWEIQKITSWFFFNSGEACCRTSHLLRFILLKGSSCNFFMNSFKIN